jgi:uncharacterized damage-inducible protein DinB
MPDYKNGRIYKLWSPQGDEIYIGSTVNSLAKRKGEHKTNYNIGNNISSKILFEKYDDVRIELIEEFPCENKQQLNAREGYYIRTLDCVNKHIAGRTQKEWVEDNKEKIKEQQKQYIEDNKEHLKNYKKEYYENNTEHIKEYLENNREKIRERHKIYIENNKEIIKEQRKEWRENNKEYLKERYKEYYKNNKDEINKRRRERLAMKKSLLLSPV